jgi:hypothetical protein
METRRKTAGMLAALAAAGMLAVQGARAAGTPGLDGAEKVPDAGAPAAAAQAGRPVAQGLAS